MRFIQCQKGMKSIGQDDCIALVTSTYGIIQASRQYYKKNIEILKKVGFIGSNVDPCLYLKKSAKRVVT